MAKERTLTRTLAITEATLTVVDKTNKTIVPDFKVTLDGHFKNEAAVLEAAKEHLEASDPNFVAVSVDSVNAFKATYEITLSDFIKHARIRPQTAETESEV